MSLHLRRGLVVGIAAAPLVWAACGETTGPSGVDASGNKLPVIVSISVPAGKVEVGQDLAVSAVVEDPDTPASQLVYSWQANVGTFSGSGASVTWRAKAGSATPVDVRVTLEVTDQTHAGGAPGADDRVSRTATPFRLHDSPAELGRMGVTFLVEYFGNSNVSPDACLVDFSDSCPGKNAERGDITANRAAFVIVRATAYVSGVTFNNARTFADILAPCTFRSREKATGMLSTVAGDCTLTGVYEQQRWWLCDSHFINGKIIEGAVPNLIQRFFGGGGG